MQQWSFKGDYLEIKDVPFYWRIKKDNMRSDKIKDRMDFRFTINDEFGFVQYLPNEEEFQNINLAYSLNENIGFLNYESGQLNTYGASANKFFLEKANLFKPKKILEIGCGAGVTIQYLHENGFNVCGIDPSEYSKIYSEKYNFELLHSFFPQGVDKNSFDMVICNDVYEHIFDVITFSKDVYESLTVNGVFCFSTTDSTHSIKIGDISMLEHQHVNMFTDVSIVNLLSCVGFKNIEIKKGTFGNTLQVVAVKSNNRSIRKIKQNNIEYFFDNAVKKLELFSKFYSSYENIGFYVPLRCIGYLASVGSYDDYIYDSNNAWHNRFIDGYNKEISNPGYINERSHEVVFIGSLTFYDEIKKFCESKGVKKVVGIENI